MADLQTQVNDLSTQLAMVTTNFQQLSQAHDALVQQLDQLKAQLANSIGTKAVETTSLHVTNGTNLDGNLAVAGTISGNLAGGIVGEPQLANGAVDGPVLASLSVAGTHLANSSVDGRILALGVVSEAHMDTAVRAKIDGALPSSGGTVGPVQFSGGFSFSNSPSVPGGVVKKAASVSVANNPLNSSLTKSNLYLFIEGPTVLFQGAGVEGSDVTSKEVAIENLVTNSVRCENVDAGGVKAIALRSSNGLTVSGGSDFDGDVRLHGGLRVLQGDATFSQNLTVNGTKHFQIEHPIKDNHFLVHSCLEGPENAVYYRGQACLREDAAEIYLPDFFESLTRPDGRSVLLTPIHNGKETLSMLSASEVVGGRFRVRPLTGRIRRNVSGGR